MMLAPGPLPGFSSLRNVISPSGIDVHLSEIPWRVVSHYHRREYPMVASRFCRNPCPVTAFQPLYRIIELGGNTAGCRAPCRDHLHSTTGQVANGVLPILCYTHCPQVLLSSVSSCAMLSAHGTMAEQKQRAEALCKIGMRSKPKNSFLVRDRFMCFEQM